MVDAYIIEKIKEEKKDDRPVLRIPLDEEYFDPPLHKEEEMVEECERGVCIINPADEEE